MSEGQGGASRNADRLNEEASPPVCGVSRSSSPPTDRCSSIGAPLVFYANWQSQYAALLHEYTRSDSIRRAVRDHVFTLQDRILAAGFYGGVERFPMRQATVEVASALEGANDAYTIAARERNARHTQAFERCIRVALGHLFRAQRLEDCAPRERGGFGHSLTDRTQRIDVTGHVVSGFVKTARNRLAGA